MLHLVTGGSGSGKSSYAEDWLLLHKKEGKAPLLYLAAMIPYGEETKVKIKRHQKLRAGKGFLTLERYTDLANLAIPENAGILLECISNLTANEFYREDGTTREKSETLAAILRGIKSLKEQTDCLVIVTNEVNSDVNGYSDTTEEYKELLGMVNRQIAALADKVTEVVYGIAVVIKE